MGRIGAFLIHLGISLLIFAVLAPLIVYVWYPDFFFASDGGWQGIRIIVLVDLVLGPLLTLVVFNRSKPRRELTRDLSIIATFQAVCLAAGVYVVYVERPLALVHSDGYFMSMSADDYRDAGVPVPDLDAFPGPWPKRLVVDLPDDPTTQAEIRRNALQQGKPLRALAAYYVPYDADLIDIGRNALTADALEAREAATGDLTAWTEEHGGSVDDYAFFPFGARYGFLILGIERASGEIVGLLDSEVQRKPTTNEAQTG